MAADLDPRALIAAVTTSGAFLSPWLSV